MLLCSNNVITNNIFMSMDGEKKFRQLLLIDYIKTTYKLQPWFKTIIIRVICMSIKFKVFEIQFPYLLSLYNSFSHSETQFRVNVLLIIKFFHRTSQPIKFSQIVLVPHGTTTKMNQCDKCYMCDLNSIGLKFNFIFKSLIVVNIH